MNKRKKQELEEKCKLLNDEFFSSLNRRSLEEQRELIYNIFEVPMSQRPSKRDPSGQPKRPEALAP